MSSGNTAKIEPAPATGAPLGAPSAHLFRTFARVDLAFERGEGAWLEGSDGRRYLDFGAGMSRRRRSGTSPTSTASRMARSWPTG